ncbi:predicted protein [Nematostella vectensis]|uniref:Peroxisomal ATPase PEX6 n=2 Tax=Nematostella vectensis TaxID=45351 RepID=A7RJ14_NEMVE|nr:predicted protein [Nematostella vectensis]|eukprot:XP_001640665.1 predicted protein [Nematostella vectensis]
MFASEVVLSLVVTPNIKKEESFNAALVRHFTTPRLLTTGDVVGIICYWKDDPSDSNDEHRSRVVYFKVTKLVSSSFENETLFVDTEHTSLYQKGFVHSFVPVLMEPVLQGVNHYKSSLIVPGHKTSQEKLEKIIRPYLSKRVNGPPFVQVLLTGLPGTGKRAICMAVSSQLNLAVQEISCFDLIGDSVAATETRIKNLFVRANDCRPCILLLRHIHAIGKDKEGQEDEPRIAATLQDCTEFIKDQSDWPLVVIATSSQPDSICSGIYASFLHEIKLESPSEQERLCMLQGISSVYSLAPDVNFEVLARRTAGFVLADFAALFTRATSIASARVTQYLTAKLHLNTKTEDPSQLFTIQQCIKSACRSGVSINFKDFQEALDALQASHADAIGAPKIPDISWKDVGGLDSVKEEILDTIQLPLLHPELFAAGLRRSGVLLYGPPGTGKTLMAKAVATECSLNFLSVKGPELINMYVGQSEQNVREVFSRAQAASPCVIFFDELDSLAPNRGRSGDSGGVMDRVVAQLLAELDGLHSTCDVFVIGATNRPDLLDPALLRPGRFDKLLYLGVSKDHHAQLSVLKALTRKFTFSADFRLEEFANKLPLNLTGADLYAMASDALLQAMRRIIQETGGNADAAEDAVIEVCLADFCVALQNLTPSVSFQELERYKQIKNTLE